MKTVVITSGYFNPIHPGHIECLQLCKELGDELWVIVNNDEQAKLKTGKSEVFQDQEFRMKVVDSIKGVDQVFLAVDEDGSVCKSIRAIAEKIRTKYGAETKIIFGKGGDRFAGNIPEVQVCKELDIGIRDGLGMKTYNSSDFRAKI
ncbi:MAG: adenylyltransferase/cytidyltransferase family protein [Candidatus Absconditicoccaceae bacterium]